MTVSKPTPAPDDYVRAAALREALNSFRRSSEIVTSANGLTSRTYQLLLMIETARLGDGGAGLSELEERLQLGKSTVTELVVRTERRGLVRRELDPQRRGAILVRLTPKGRRQLAKAVGELGNERDRLIELLSRLAGDEPAESTA